MAQYAWRDNLANIGFEPGSETALAGSAARIDGAFLPRKVTPAYSLVAGGVELVKHDNLYMLSNSPTYGGAYAEDGISI
jgi:hypothetical protein